MGGGGGGGRILRSALMGMGKVTPPPPTTMKGVPDVFSSHTTTTTNNHAWTSTMAPRIVSIPSSSFSFSSQSSVEANEALGSYVFGQVPTEMEVEEAVSALEEIFIPDELLKSSVTEISSSIPDKEEEGEDLQITKSTPFGLQHYYTSSPLQLCHTETSKTQGFIDSFRSVQTNPSIKKVVVSLSSDKAVWDAIMNNDAVKELRESFCSAENHRNNSNTDDANFHKSSTINDEHDDISSQIFSCVLSKIKVKMMEIFERFGRILSDIFHFKDEGKKGMIDDFGDSLSSSFFISVVVIFVVILFRGHRQP